jgi:hypothetical protein
MGKHVHTGCWLRKVKEKCLASEAHGENKYIRSDCWLRKLKEKMLKSDNCRMEDNTKINIREMEMVFEFFRLRKGTIPTIFNMVVKFGLHK